MCLYISATHGTMNYRELFQFDAIADAVRLSDAATKDGATRLVSNWVISEERASSLTGLIFPNLQFDQPANSKALFIVGCHGSGKSHLLSVLSGLAEHADLVEATTNRAALRVSPAAKSTGSVGMEAVAGRFKVIRTEVDGAAKSLKGALLGRLESYLATLGVAYAFPTAAPTPGEETAFDQMMAAFHASFPAHGLLLVADELFDYLGARTGQELISDLGFLAEVGAACQRSKFRFVAGLREVMVDKPEFASAAASLRAVQERFEQVLLGPKDLRCVVSERMVRKTLAQRTQVEKYLTKFAKCYGSMKARMGEFVALFPIHPDYLEVCGKLAFTDERELLRTLSDATQKLLDETVPQDQPGLIAYDSYWDRVCQTPAFQELLDVEAVTKASLTLEAEIKKSEAAPERKAMALRLLQALSVHRLSTGDIYSHHGPTAAELRDSLCLYHPGAEELGDNSATDLLGFVRGTLDLFKELSHSKLLTFDPDHDHYYLHQRHFRRFVNPELLLHWVNAVPFGMLIFTGGIMLASRFWLIDHHTFVRVVFVHKLFASLWFVGLPLVLCLQPKVHWLHLRLMLRWGVGDLHWVVQSVRSNFDKTAIVPPAGRFNTGQKINACLVMVYYFGFATTGLLIHFNGATLLPWYIHTALFFASMNTVGGHLFLALANPSTRISLPGIFHGWAPMEYIEHHHPLSLPKARHSHVHPGDGPKGMRDIIGPKVQVIMLVVSLLMATVGAWAFHKGLMTSAQLHFTKSFSALISPRQLSTKHRMAASSERCTKCHTYTGGIPDANCEQCHQIVKERRGGHIGYHGTLTGECSHCHKEHPPGTNSVIPLIRADFKHAVTGFILQGKHGQLQCDECHKKKRTPEMPGIYYIGLKREACTDCHAEPHDKQFTAACAACHSANGWKGKDLNFNHAADSAFKLSGKHSALDCRKCHKPVTPEASLATGRFKGLPQDCKGCHEDPHRQQFVAVCISCHSPEGWKRDKLLFDHNKDVKFPLLAKHAEVACEKCHIPSAPGEHLASAIFRGLKSECADCHKDPHRNQFERTCARCHSPAGWKKEHLSFDHNKDAKFSLVAKHTETACEKCHPPAAPGETLGSAQFRGLKSECADCHKDPHAGQFERACTKCHTVPAVWTLKGLQFEHTKDTKFALSGKHASVECIKCHKPRLAGGQLASATFKGMGTGCETCHKVKHPEEYGATCVSCHSFDLWTKKKPGAEHILKFEVNGEHLSGKHLTAKCSACHQTARIATLGQSKAPGIECNTCHKSEDPHKGGLGINCVKCHTLEGWKGEHLRFTHDAMTRFGLDQDHKRLACAKCHEIGHWKTKGTTCANCHPNFYGNDKK